MKNKNFYTVTGWMINDLKLSGNELICYAIIYGFSQDGESMFMGSSKYLAEWMNASQPTVLKVLKKLVEKRLITKHEEIKDKVRLCYYQNAYNEETVGTKEPLVGGTKEPLADINNNIKKEKKDNNKLLSKKNEGKEGSLFDEKPTEEELFNAWFQLKFPVLSKNKRPMTLKNFKALEAEQFTDEQILNKLDYMEARKRFNHDYTDVYRVCRNWLMSDRDPNYRDRFRKNKKDEPKTQQ